MLQTIQPPAPFAAEGKTTSLASPVYRYGPEALGALVALVVAALFLTVEPSPDVAWQLWIGHQLNHGARFYVDIIETNPPLWFWMAMPIDRLASLLGTGPYAPLVATMGFASALGVIATGRLLPHVAAPVRAAILVYAALALMVMPLQDMGQREQILLIGALPYTALAAARYERRLVSPWLAVAIGLGSALGFALKHYFLIAPALLELWLLIGLRRGYRPLRPETIALGLMALLYAAAMLLFAPAYLTQIVPMLRLVYGATNAGSLAAMIGIDQCLWVAMAALLLARPRLLAATPLASAFSIAALGFACAWYIQFKGWHYHGVPTTGCLMMALALLATRHWRRLPPLVWMAAPAIIAAPVALAAATGPYRDHLEAPMRPIFAGLARHDSVAIVSEQEAYAWPFTLRRGFFYPSRHYGMWMLHALMRDGNNPAIARLADQAVLDTAQDYSCAQPVRIIFDQAERGGFDLEAYFLSHPRFAALMGHYRRIGRFHQFDVFQRIAPFPAPPAASCRRGV